MADEQQTLTSPPEQMEIPEKFFTCGCCAMSCCDWDKCFGCKNYAHCLCLQGEGLCCKFYSDDNTCCIFQRSLCELVPCSLYNCYEQACCCECMFSCCCNLKEVYNKAPSGTTVDNSTVGQPLPVDITVLAALCCSFLGCYSKCPECIGCASNAQFCCLKESAICCKPLSDGDDINPHGACCLLQKAECLCVPLNTCCKGSAQTFCLFSNCACPCDDEVPCAFGHLCAVCCVNWGCHPECCPTLQHIYEVAHPQKYTQAADAGNANKA